MTLAVRVLGTWTVGQYGTLAVDVTSANPVSAITVDFQADGQPAWYYVVNDARPTVNLLVGPLRRAGRYNTIIWARDQRGCEIQNVPGLYVTVER